MAATSSAFLSCITSKTLTAGAATNATCCPQLICFSKDGHSAVRSSNEQLKADAVSKQASRMLQRRTRLCHGGIGVVEVSKNSVISPRRGPTVAAVSDQDEALPQSVDAPTVKVKFVLQRECLFGQKFGVVGEDAALGAWDPDKAFGLEWSNDHTWTGELDLPVGKKHEYKFVLVNEDGVLEWQPDPNGAFETSENTPLVIVSEHWFEESNKVATLVDSDEVLDIHEENKATNAEAEIEAVPESMNEKPYLFGGGNDVVVAAPMLP